MTDESWPHLSSKNLFNLLLLLLVPVPSVVVSMQVFSALDDPAGAAGWVVQLAGWHPIVFVNVLFFVNVCLGFWVIALFQRSTWLIDPYWTLIPLFIAHFYQLQAAHGVSGEAAFDGVRAAVTLVLLWVWSARLTGSYFRRERWKFGVREDWRFAKKRQESGQFWWQQFFYAFLSQHFMLVGLTLPYFAVFQSSTPFDWLDRVMALAAIAGVTIAHVADTQLYQFVEANKERVSRGKARVQLLETGLWRLSRHPNYFGEQLFWWAIAGYGIKLGMAWSVAGTVLNSIVLLVVTQMTEARMMERPDRVELYQEYKKRTRMWLPLPRLPNRGG